MKKLKNILFILLINPSLVLAAPLIDDPTGPPKTSPQDFYDFVIRVKDILLGAVGLIAVAMIVYGGFLYMMAGGNEERVKKAKAVLMWAVLGLILVICSWAVVYLYANLLGGNVEGGI